LFVSGKDGDPLEKNNVTSNDLGCWGTLVCQERNVASIRKPKAFMHGKPTTAQCTIRTLKYRKT
jgi:hypothetical protein